MMSERSSTCDYERSSSPEGLYSSPGQIRNKEDIYSALDTPVKKNKRKRSEPRKRTDFSIKRFCPDSPGGGSACSDSGRSDDVQEEPPDTPDRSDQSPSELSINSGHSSHGPADSEVTPNVIPPGMFMFPGHFPPGYMVPSLYKHHPAFLPPPPNNFARMDLINNNKPSAHENITQHSSEYEDLTDNSMSDKNSKKSRKNYKNMTRERRVEANARERTRVHTISAAFENLRRAVPSYSYNQKLSKLAILRIASSYIMALGKLAENDEDDRNRESFGELVDLCTRTIQTEGRARRRH